MHRRAQVQRLLLRDGPVAQALGCSAHAGSLLLSGVQSARRAWPRACPRLEHTRGICHFSARSIARTLEWHEPVLAVAVSFCLPTQHPTRCARVRHGRRAVGRQSAVCGSSASSAAATLWAVSAPCSASGRGSRVVTTHGWLPRLCVGRLPISSVHRRLRVWVFRVAYRWHAFLTCLGQ